MHKLPPLAAFLVVLGRSQGGRNETLLSIGICMHTVDRPSVGILLATTPSLEEIQPAQDAAEGAHLS